MHSDRNDDVNSRSAPDLKGPRQPSRRQLLRAGLGASPVVLTMMSRPVSANTVDNPCRSPSALASFNANPMTSRAVVQSCSGSAGPAAYRDAYNFTFGSGVYAAAAAMEFTGYRIEVPVAKNKAKTTIIQENPTIGQVLQYGPSANVVQILALRIAAARVNVHVGATPLTVVTDAQLKAMWASAGTLNGTAPGGTYPVTGVSGGWSATELNVWLASTWPSSS